MPSNDIKSINKAAYMFDQKTDYAWDTLHKKITPYNLNKQRILFLNHRPLLKIAASIVLFISIAWFFSMTFNNPTINSIQTKAYQINKILPDGTTVYLNGNSEINFPKQFSSTSREIKLTGEAFFYVVKDPKRPFIITANNARIEVLGTSFNILADNNGKSVEVFVETGTVSLSSINNSKKLILTKGQHGLFHNKFLSKSGISDQNYLSWKTKLIDFKEAPLNYVVNVLNKTYLSNIIIEDKFASNLKLNAKFEKTSLDTVLQSICLAFNLEQKLIDENIHLVHKTE